MATFDQFVSSIRQEFGEQDAGKKFEVFCKWFLENDPEWSKKVDKVWLWDEYPNKWQRQDLGTDLVFRDNDGLIWAVQAKCYSEHRTTTKGDMNSFLADTGRPEVDRRLWLQTTNKIEAKAEKTYKGQDKHVTIINLNNFRDAQIDYPSSFADLYKAKVKDKPKPDPHQVKAIADVTAGLQKSDRGQMIMACGTGKTFTTLWIKEALKSDTTLVLLPSLSLLSQTMREWAWAGNTDFEILNVCSDKSVGKKTEDMAPSDAPFAVTSDVQEISKFLQKSGARVVFCTYQSSQLIAEAQIDTKVPTFDLAIADEAHRCAGKADAGFATILDGEKIRASKRLFTTATPRYFGKAIKDASKAADLAVIGMDDETVFGSVIHQLTFGQAIQDEHLNDYQVVIVGVDEPMVKQWIDNYEIVATNPDETTDARTLAAKIGMLKAVKDYDLKRVISFHSRVSGAKKFSEELTEVADLIEPANRPDGTFLSDYVSGAMKAGDRKDKIDKLKELEGHHRGILTNARCLAEGVDVPSLDGVAFIDPKGSQVEIIQAVGRAIRKVRGTERQTKGTIVIPVFIEDGDDHEASIEASNFKPVWDVLKALRAHDEVLADALDQYRTNMAKNSSQASENISDKIVFDLPMSVNAEFSSALRTVLVEASTESWEFWFGLLDQFKKQEGDCRVPRSYKEDEYNLGGWVSSQRARKESLPSERKQRLDDLGFVWDPHTKDWEEGFSKLSEFKEKEGHCAVPNDYHLNGYNLGGWASTQRVKKNELSNERIERLKELGFIWDLVHHFWDEGYKYLVKYKKENGNLMVPNNYVVENYKLGAWVARQRSNKEKLTNEQKNRLNELGFVWAPMKQAWEQGLNSLRNFKKLEGHCNVPTDFQIDGFKLGQWVRWQRVKKKNMLNEQVESLNSLGFIWDMNVYFWDEGYKYLVKYKKENGNLMVPNNYVVENYKLGAWVARQRSNKEKLTNEQKNRLNELGFVWAPMKQAWEQGLNSLRNFKKLEGHCNVPTDFQIDGFKLGQWVSVQRVNKESIPLHRKRRLDALGFIWDNRDAAWEEGYKSLQDFKENTGHCNVSQRLVVDNFKLGQWVSVQRVQKENLHPERKERLEALGFVWEPINEVWEQAYKKLHRFTEIKGHCNVPKDFLLDGFPLDRWVKNQRANRENLSNDRVQRLDSLGFIWNKHYEYWYDGYQNLVDFKKSYGHCRVPHNFIFNDHRLGAWVRKKRQRMDLLTDDQIEALNNIGFVWDVNKRSWEDYYQQLIKFKEKEGHCKVPQQFEIDGFALGRWVGKQRQAGEKMKLERLEKLNRIGFVWDTLEHAWEDGFQNLLIFKKENGHLNIPARFVLNDFNLGAWVNRQRNFREKLSPTRKDRLESIGFIWSVRRR